MSLQFIEKNNDYTDNVNLLPFIIIITIVIIFCTFVSYNCVFPILYALDAAYILYIA